MAGGGNPFRGSAQTSVQSEIQSAIFGGISILVEDRKVGGRPPVRPVAANPPASANAVRPITCSWIYLSRLSG